MGICVRCTELTDKSSLENSLLVKRKERTGRKTGVTHSYGRFADWQGSGVACLPTRGCRNSRL